MSSMSIRRTTLSIRRKGEGESESTLHTLEYKEEDRHIAHCLEFDLVAEGVTPSEARSNLADLISSYIQFGKDRGIGQFTYHPAPKKYWDKYAQSS